MARRSPPAAIFSPVSTLPFYLSPPLPKLGLHVHPLELEKTNLLFPGTLYPLLPGIVLCSRKMAKKKNPIVFMDVSIGDEPDERMFFEFFLKWTDGTFDLAPVLLSQGTRTTAFRSSSTVVKETDDDGVGEGSGGSVVQDHWIHLHGGKGQGRWRWTRWVQWQRCLGLRVYFHGGEDEAWQR
ncbi:hypothetical protein OsI_15363 [Oryza sativa Indica Group]|uniref:Uncharacterized protein n=1 Tax=Oryza sativa subsp. indica TaxID=39946 RepID=A2XRW8_ORYSI|nr:hypothetical protein OsI_15363 [Oryza sativa Indica Group]